MPPPQRIPSLPGATQASKKAFKPPARVSSSGSSTIAPVVADHSTSRSTISNGFNRATTDISAPKQNQAGPSRDKSTASNVNAAVGMRGGNASVFTKASAIEDVDMFSDIDDDDDDLELEILDNLSTKQTTRTTAKPAEPMTNRRRNLAEQLPALSQSPDPSARQLSPDNVEVTGEGRTAVANIGTESDDIPLLPGPLLTRLLHESFDDKQMKIGRDANALMARYMDIFVREAVARAEEAHIERARQGVTGADEDMDGGGIFLDTKDLEDVAPGLVLDF